MGFMVVSAVDLLYAFGRSLVLSDQVTLIVQFAGNHCSDLVSARYTRDVGYGGTE